MENNTTIKEDEIDLIGLIQKVWKSRKSIALFTLIFLVIGILAALFASKEYTASTIMIPQTSDNKASGGLSGLAAMAGISLGGGSSDAVPLTTYTKIIESIPFKKKLIQTPLTFKDFRKNITYEEYMKEYTKPSLLGRVIGIFKSSTPPAEPQMSDSLTVTAISNEERSILNSIDNNIKLDLNEKEGYIVDEASNGHDGLERLKYMDYSCVLLDVQLPMLNGKSILSELRKTKATPVIIMSAQADEQSRVEGFELGADDYVVKPFSPRELMLRINAILQRTKRSVFYTPELYAKDVLVFPGLIIDVNSHKVIVDDSEVLLTPKPWSQRSLAARDATSRGTRLPNAG